MRVKLIIFVSVFVFTVMQLFAAELDFGQYNKHILEQNPFESYMSNVSEKIKNTWNPPDVLEKGHTIVVFKLCNDGSLVSVYVKESSGNNLYDQSAIESIQKASPFDVFPENASRDTITIQYSFDSSVVNNDSIKQLVEMAEKFERSDKQLALEYLNKAIEAIQGDPSSYFLHARKHKINISLGNTAEAKKDMEECLKLKALYNERRIKKCKQALSEEETPFGYFSLANAYELAGDYQNAIASINKAISMTDLNHAYKRYRAEIIMKNEK